MDLLPELLKILTSRYGADTSSFKTNKSALNAFIKRTNGALKTKEDLKRKYKSILKLIETSDRSIENKRKIIYLLSILLDKMKLKKAHSMYIERYIEMKNELLDNAKKNKPMSEKETKCLNISLEQLRANKIDIEDLNPLTFIYNLLVFIDETPRLDYRQLQNNPSSSKIKKNYINLVGKKCVIVLNLYKTSKTYGTWRIKIENQELCTYIKMYLNANNIKKNDYIFTNKHGAPYASSKFSLVVQRAFKKKVDEPISINCLRKIKENYLFHKNPKILNMSMHDKEEYVKRYFRHNLKTSNIYYKRVGSNTEDTDNTKQITDTIDPKRIKSFIGELKNLIKEYEVK